MKRKQTTTFVEEWEPTQDEIKKFFEFMKKYTKMHDEKKEMFNGREMTIRAGMGYVERDSKEKAMSDFGAVTLDYKGSGQWAVKLATSNDFMKSGTGKVILYKQFEVLERKYFAFERSKQKSMDIFEQAPIKK